MANVNLNNPMEIRRIGMEALRKVLGPAGMIKFMQQYDKGYGDYTKEKQEKHDISLDEIENLLRTQEK